jgi:hypothetical protein
MSELHEVVIDKRAADYVREHLTDINVLCSELVSVLETEPGEIFTLCPVGTPAETIYQFTSGGLLPENLDFSRATHYRGKGTIMPKESLSFARATRIKTLLGSVPSAVCVVDDFDLCWPELRPEQKATAVSVGDAVYHVLTAEAQISTIDTTLRQARFIWHGVAATCNHSLQLAPGRTAEPEALRQCARAVIEFTCVAYDGEGFVGWRRMSD